MSIALDELDELPSAEAGSLLHGCCGSSRWVEAMVARRPFHTLDTLLAEADDAWWSLEPDDWDEAFAHHPRIGERSAGGWSAREQAGVDAAGDDVRAALAQVNREYEARFGRVYLVCATGRSAEELLAIARARLANDPETELRVAAEEQAKITALRLRALVTEEPAP